MRGKVGNGSSERGSSKKDILLPQDMDGNTLFSTSKATCR